MAHVFHATCWKDWQEWRHTYTMLYSFQDIASQIEGLKLVDVWRSRKASKLPVAVECTANLVAANIGLSNSLFEDKDRTLSIAMALVRFVNSMVDQVQRGVYARSIQEIADEIEIPDWLVDIRHEATHASLPSIDVLELGLQVALRWLDEKYWKVTYDNSFKTKQAVQLDMVQLLDNYIMIRRSNANANETKQLLDTCMVSICKPLTGVEEIRSFIPLLLKHGALLPDKDHLASIMESKDSTKIMSDYIALWMPLMKTVQDENCNFLLELIKILIRWSGEKARDVKLYINNLLLKLIKELSPNLQHPSIVCNLLHYCLLNPTEESLDILQQIRIQNNFDNKIWKKITDLFKLVASAKGIWSISQTSEDLYSSSTEENCSNLFGYLEKFPIDGVDIEEIKNELGGMKTGNVKHDSWMQVYGIDWKNIPLGSYLNDYQPINRNDTCLPILPSKIDDLYKFALSGTHEQTLECMDKDNQSWLTCHGVTEKYDDVELDNNDENSFAYSNEEIKTLSDSIVLF
eukprot:gene12060-13303_t